MFPVLFHIGSFPINTYGVLIAFGFLLAVWVFKKDCERCGLPSDKLVDLAFWSLLVGLMGARLLFVLTRWQIFVLNPISVFYIWEGGLVFFGAPLVCIPLFYFYLKKHRLPYLKVLDLAAAAIPLAHAIGRTGCLAAGCCHGRPTRGSWGIKLYSELVEPALRGIYLHPTQIYEAVILLLLFFFLRWYRQHQKFDGQIVLSYLILYSVTRSINEVFRGDSIRGFIIPEILSTSQFISILVVVGSLWCGYKLWRRSSQST